MATKSIVPRADGEGGIGTAAKKWLNGWINNLVVASIKITTGAGASKVLTSDADGDATWETSSTVTYASAAEINTGTEAAKAIAPDQFALAARGKLVQVAYNSIETLVSGNTAIPNDNTIPQNTEGFEVITCAITPKSVSNLLVIICSKSIGYYSSLPGEVMALFQDATAGALRAMGITAAMDAATMIHKMTAGTTSATTFKLRVGPTGTETHYVNTVVGGNTVGFGGVQGTSITIFEYAP